MPIRVDAYTNTGMANGWLLDAAHLREALERGQPLELTRVTWQAMRGPRTDHARHARVRTRRPHRRGRRRREHRARPRRLALGRPRGRCLPHRRRAADDAGVRSRAGADPADRRVRAAPRRPRRDQGPARRRRRRRSPTPSSTATPSSGSRPTSCWGSSSLARSWIPSRLPGPPDGVTTPDPEPSAADSTDQEPADPAASATPATPG